MLMLALARLLIAAVRFGRWKGWLGSLDRAVASGPGAATGEAHRLARVVERGGFRLPVKTLCLPRAMALHWMLRRRGIASALVFAVLPGQRRGSLNDLHAWVEQNGEIILGASEDAHSVLARFG